MKNRLIRLGVVFIALVTGLLVAYNVITINANKVLVTNSSSLVFDEMKIVFGGEEQGVVIKSSEKIDVPDGFEAAITLDLKRNGEEKRYTVKGYYGSYEMKYIKVEVKAKSGASSLDDVTIAVNDGDWF